MSNAKHKIPFEEALAIAERAAGAISTRFDEVNICGSLRRMMPMVGDIDFVVIGELDESAVRSCLLNVFDEAVRDEGNGPGRPRVCHTVRSPGIDIGIDVWMVPPRFHGSAVMHATGSGLFNAVLRRWARSQGLMLDVWGVHLGDRIVASETEHDCFAALGLPFLNPRDRHPGSLDPMLDKMNGEAS